MHVICKCYENMKIEERFIIILTQRISYILNKKRKNSSWWTKKEWRKPLLYIGFVQVRCSCPCNYDTCWLLM